MVVLDVSALLARGRWFDLWEFFRVSGQKPCHCPTCRHTVKVDGKRCAVGGDLSAVTRYKFGQAFEPSAATPPFVRAAHQFTTYSPVHRG